MSLAGAEPKQAKSGAAQVRHRVGTRTSKHYSPGYTNIDSAFDRSDDGLCRSGLALPEPWRGHHALRHCAETQLDQWPGSFLSTVLVNIYI
jgi:hypothetical protein